MSSRSNIKSAGSKLNKGNTVESRREEARNAYSNVMFVDYGDNPLSYNTSNIDNVNRALWKRNRATTPLTAANVSDSNFTVDPISFGITARRQQR